MNRTNERKKIDVYTRDSVIWSQIGMRSSSTMTTNDDDKHQYVDYFISMLVSFSLACILSVCCVAHFNANRNHHTHTQTLSVNVYSIELNWMNAMASCWCRSLFASQCIESFAVPYSSHLLQLPMVVVVVQLLLMPSSSSSQPPHCWFVFIWTSQSNGFFCEIFYFVCRLLSSFSLRLHHCTALFEL